jgi:outer membrane autotransporter protein
MASDNAYIRPMLGLGVSYVSRDAYEESGAGGANLRVEKASDTFVSLHPAIEFGGESSVGGEGTLLRHFVRVGMTQFLGSNERQVTASLEGAPSGIQPFTVTTRSEKTFADLAIGVDILRKSGTTVRLEYSGQFSNNSTTHALGVKIAMPF